MRRAQLNAGQRQRQVTIPGGPRGTELTLAAMKALVHGTDLTMKVHQLATRLAAGPAQFDRRAQLLAVYDFLRVRVRFKADIFNKETLRSPDQLIAEIVRHGVTSADCDDVAMLGAALVRAMGFRAAFVVYARTRSGPWQHVAYAIDQGGAWVPFDPQERVEPGKWSPNVRKLLYPID